MSPGMAQELEHNDKLPYMLRTMGDTCSCGPQKHSLRKATHARTHVAGTTRAHVAEAAFVSVRDGVAMLAFTQDTVTIFTNANPSDRKTH